MNVSKTFVRYMRWEVGVWVFPYIYDFLIEATVGMVSTGKDCTIVSTFIVTLLGYLVL